MRGPMNVFEAYGWKQGEAHGWKKGTAYGKEEERKSLLEAAKGKGPEVYLMLQQLIAEVDAGSKK